MQTTENNNELLKPTPAVANNQQNQNVVSSRPTLGYRPISEQPKTVAPVATPVPSAGVMNSRLPTTSRIATGTRIPPPVAQVPTPAINEDDDKTEITDPIDGGYANDKKGLFKF